MKAAKTIKANNFEQTVNQVPKEWGIDIPDTISELEKDYYHILIVTRTHIPEQETYRTSARVSKVRADFWNHKKNPIDKSWAALGYRNRFVLHDPSKPAPAPKKAAGRPKKSEESKETSSED